MCFNMVTNPEGKGGRESITQFLTTLTVDYGDLRMKWASSTQDSEEPRLSTILKCIRLGIFQGKPKAVEG